MRSEEANQLEEAHDDLPDDGSTDLLRRSLGHVQRHQNREGSDTEASHPTAHDNANPHSRANGLLHNNTDAENQTPPWDTRLATESVRDGCCNQASNESTNGELSCDQPGPEETRITCVLWEQDKLTRPTINPERTLVKW